MDGRAPLVLGLLPLLVLLLPLGLTDLFLADQARRQQLVAQ
jgi:hypothetical protein